MKNTKNGGRTSEDVSRTGTYTPECCNVEVFFEKGKPFQRCPKCLSLADWQLVSSQQQNAA
jgi:hypothetical protein